MHLFLLCLAVLFQFDDVAALGERNGEAAVLIGCDSGEAVEAALQFYKLDIDRLIVVYDDISLDPGKLRIRRKGSDGGHNGIKSIIALTGSQDFARIKVGVGKKPHKDYNLADWVLSQFKKDEMPLMEEACRHACECLELMVQGKTDAAMNKFNA